MKGNDAEGRFFDIVRSIKDSSLPKIRRIRRTGSQFDQLGVDFVVFLIRSDSRDIKVPFQIKSSYPAVKKFYKTHPTYKHLGVILIVINSYRSDDEISKEIVARLNKVLFEHRNYDEFFKLIHPKKEVKRAIPRFGGKF